MKVPCYMYLCPLLANMAPSNHYLQRSSDVKKFAQLNRKALHAGEKSVLKQWDKHTVSLTAHFTWGMKGEVTFQQHCIVQMWGEWRPCINREKVLTVFSLAMHILHNCYAFCATFQTKLFMLVKQACRYKLPFLRSHTGQTGTDKHTLLGLL